MNMEIFFNTDNGCAKNFETGLQARPAAAIDSGLLRPFAPGHRHRAGASGQS
jgi:hypothetical protein